MAGQKGRWLIGILRSGETQSEIFSELQIIDMVASYLIKAVTLIREYAG